jgi:putative colanic acid biosynthesis glycosyltransferase
MSPLLSVVTVCFNDAVGLNKTARSVAGLGFPVEWIVVDGGSKDGSVDFLKSNKFINQWVSESDDGIYDAMRKGLQMASGEFVIFMNSGDCFIGDSPEMLNDLSMICDSVDVLYAGAKFVYANGTSRFRLARNPDLYVYHSVPSNQQSTVYRVSFLRSIWGNDVLWFRICGDYYLSAKLHANGAKSKSVPEVISEFYVGGRSTFALRTQIYESWVIQRDTLKLNIVFRFVSALVRSFNILRVMFFYYLSILSSMAK